MVSLAACGALLGCVISVAIQGLSWTNGVVSSLSVGWLLFMVWDGAGWRRRFAPREKSGHWQIANTPGFRIPRLTYRTLRSSNDERDALQIDFGLAVRFSIHAAAPPLLEPDFDRHLGISGPPLVRALLGVTLSQQLVRWHLQLGLTFQKGVLHIPLDPSVDQFDFANEVIASFGVLVDRLADPETALAERVRTEPPFHAMLAWQVLKRRSPDAAHSLMGILEAQQPERAAVLKAEDAPFDRSVERDHRVAVFCAMLSSMPRRARDGAPLVDELFAQTPQTLEDAMALLAMLDATTGSVRLRRSRPLRDAVSACLIDRGDLTNLDWLAERARTRSLNRDSERLAGRIKARLHADHAGHLALETVEKDGALSDARAGELSDA
jgi:hypothetical protein